MPRFTKSIVSALAGASLVAAHGHVTHIVINGVLYPNFDPTSHPYLQNPPTVVGWTAANTDNGFVAPDQFASGDIICHNQATNAGGHAVVAAGDKIWIQWDQWPESHHGPVLDYLASCGSSGCESVNKLDLEFFKIGEKGLIDGSSAPGRWASDELIANNAGWLVQIPADIAPGHYVLRHEIIALHAAGQPNGAQNYPQCFNLLVTGSGTARPQGVKGTALYTPNDKGILAGIYNAPVSYEIPGPALYSGAARNLQQSSSQATSTATALTGDAVPVPTQAPVTTTSSSSADAATATSTTVQPPQQTTLTTAIATSTAAAAPTTTAGSGNGGNRPFPTRCPGLAGLGFDKRRRQLRAEEGVQVVA